MTALPGTVQLAREWVLVTRHDADRQAGAHVRDEIEMPGLGRLRVKAVYPGRLDGWVRGVVASLEHVS